MPKFRIERTELHTRVWEIESDSEEIALDVFTQEPELEDESYHSGSPDIRIVEIKPDMENV